MTDREIDQYIKIKDTKYDRHRKVTKEMSDEMFLMRYRYKMKYKDIAEKFGVSVSTVMYNIDSDFRDRVLSSQSGDHVGKNTCTFKERVEYKRSILKGLIESGSVNSIL